MDPITIDNVLHLKHSITGEQIPSDKEAVLVETSGCNSTGESKVNHNDEVKRRSLRPRKSESITSPVKQKRLVKTALQKSAGKEVLKRIKLGSESVQLAELAAPTTVTEELIADSQTTTENEDTSQVSSESENLMHNLTSFETPVVQTRSKKKFSAYTKKPPKPKEIKSKNEEAIEVNSTELSEQSMNVDESSKEANSCENNNSQDEEVFVKKALSPDCEMPDVDVVGDASNGSFELKPNVTFRCECLKDPLFMGNIVNSNTDQQITCQAVSKFDNCDVGCCNTLEPDSLKFFRSGVQSRYQLLCFLHQERLKRHMSCPICGKFCTEGTYVACPYNHIFHLECFDSLSLDNREYCLHCGDSAQTRLIELNLKLKKPIAFLPSAKGHKTARISAKLENGLLPNESAKFENNLPSELDHWQNTDFGLNKETLELLLNVACSSIRSPSDSALRYTQKSFITACRSGDAAKVVKCVSTGIFPMEIYSDGVQKSGLHLAAEQGHVPVVHVLLQLGINKDMLDGNNQTALMSAIANNKNDVVAYLLMSGASLTIKGSEGRTPLHVAVRTNNLDACKLLLTSSRVPKGFIDDVDDGKWTALVWACEYKDLEVARYLLSKGARVDIPDKEHNIAIHWVAYGGNEAILTMFLQRYDVDISTQNVKGDTPLHIAARQNHTKCVLTLLAHGAKSNVPNNLKELPHMCAIESSNVYRFLCINQELQNIMKRFKSPIYKILCNDISRGLEKYQIQCVNEVDDDVKPPLDFRYMTKYCYSGDLAIDWRISIMEYCKCGDQCVSNCKCQNHGHWYDDSGFLVPHFNFSQCVDVFECNQLCRCNKLLCKNRVVQNGTNNRFQLFKTKDRGWGLKTLTSIPKGMFVCEYVGEILTDTEADNRPDDSYLFDLDNRDLDSYCIDARFYGNMSRFINHFCVPNLSPVCVYSNHNDYRFPRMAFFACRDIDAYEELGYNYGDKFWAIKSRKFPCCCGHKNCKYGNPVIEKKDEKEV